MTRCAAPEPVAHIKLIAERLGLPLRQFVALTGVHPVARWWRDVQPPYMEQFYCSPPHHFNNSYFRCSGQALSVREQSLPCLALALEKSWEDIDMERAGNVPSTLG